MSRPPGPELDVHVDVLVLAHNCSGVERQFPVSQLPRTSEAGIAEPGEVRVVLRGSTIEGRVALDGELTGAVTMVCQRCMRPVRIEMHDEFQLLLVRDESERQQLEEAGGGYEPIIADPARLDVRWLAEEQALLNAPLVPKHADEKCADDVARSDEAAAHAEVAQRPFANLKEMLRGK